MRRALLGQFEEPAEIGAVKQEGRVFRNRIDRDHKAVHSETSISERSSR